MNKLKMIFALILWAAGALLFAGGHQDATVPKEPTGKVTVYLSGPAAMINQLEQTFEREHGDVLEIVHMGCGPLRQRVWAELESGEIQADVIWGSDPLLYYALDAREALSAYNPEGTDQLAARFRSNGHFTYVSERYGVVIYNEEILGENPPETFSDLLAVEYAEGVVHADPAQSSTALALIAGLWNLDGVAGSFHEALAEGGLFLARKNSDVPSKIQEGEFLAGIAPHDAVFRLQMKAQTEGYETPLAMSWPSEGAVAIQRPVAICKDPRRSAEDTALAEAFVDFLLSRQAQQMMAQSGFFSVREDVPSPKGIPEDLSLLYIDWSRLSEEQNSIEQHFRSYFQ